MKPLDDVSKAGKALRSYATHHSHGAGWTYSRQTKIHHIRYFDDYKGHGRLDRRFLSGLQQAFGKPVFGAPWWKGTPRRIWFHIYYAIRANVWESNGPDGGLNGGGVIVHWEEDGEYLEWVGPTVGVKIADFLEAEPNHPHAVAIAAEMRRVRQLGRDRRIAEKTTQY